VKQARRAGFGYHARCPAAQLSAGKLMDGGLLVLSRYPITTAEWCQFDTGVGVDRIAGKGVLYVALELGTQCLHLFNTHMQASYAQHDDDATVRCKSAQVPRIWIRFCSTRRG
jgi:hypothetical protein